MKNELRREYIKKRLDMTRSEVDEKSLAAQRVFLESGIYRKCSALMLYMPIKNETDTAEIFKKALSDGKKTVFPSTDCKTCAITPIYAGNAECFKTGAFSVPEPIGAVADAADLDAVLVPGVIFGKNGARTGFGKGCYDRFLSGLGAVKVGFCYDFQLRGDLCTDLHDVNMDYIVTEKGMIKC